MVPLIGSVCFENEPYKNFVRNEKQAVLVNMNTKLQ